VPFHRFDGETQIPRSHLLSYRRDSFEQIEHIASQTIVFVRWQLGTDGLVDVFDANARVAAPCIFVKPYDLLGLFVEFILNLADNLFDNILETYDAGVPPYSSTAMAMCT